MRKLMLFASATAMALTMPALASDRDRGGDRGRDGRQSAEARAKVSAERGARAERRGDRRQARQRSRARVERRGGRARAERRQARAEQRRGARVRAERRQARAEQRRGARVRAERRQARAEQRQAVQRRQPVRAQRRAARARVERRQARRVAQIRAERRQTHLFLRQARQAEARSLRDLRRRALRERRIDRREWRRWAERRFDRDRDDDRFDHRWRDRRASRAAWRFGCPPGLVAFRGDCWPRGQFRRARLIGRAAPNWIFAEPVPVRYRYRFADDARHAWRWNDGYAYRLDRGSNVVRMVVPVHAGGLFVGEPMPLGYEVYNVPIRYRPYYADTADAYYRYDDGAIYRVDRRSGLVDAIVALLTSGAGGLGGLGVGDMLPAGYDAYNVPFDYRDTYYDSGDSIYRYADGAIYQVDPETRLIESVISLLA